jgi:hypothetical protein
MRKQKTTEAKFETFSPYFYHQYKMFEFNINLEERCLEVCILIVTGLIACVYKVIKHSYPSVCEEDVKV